MLNYRPLNLPIAQKIVAVKALLFSQCNVGATTPLLEQLYETGVAVYGNVRKANHVFGYRFRVLEARQIEQVGGYFSGRKTLLIFNDSDQLVAATPVNGNGSGFTSSTLNSPLLVEAGQIYRVLVRAGTD